MQHLKEERIPDVRALVRSMKVWRRHGQIAVHKPLLLLVAISRLAKGHQRLAGFTDYEEELEELLRQFAGVNAPNAVYPFWRLQTDGLWEVSTLNPLRPRRGNTDPTRRSLVDGCAMGGLPREIYVVLRQQRALRNAIVAELLGRFFSAKLHTEIVSQLDLLR